MRSTVVNLGTYDYNFVVQWSISYPRSEKGYRFQPFCPCILPLWAINEKSFFLKPQINKCALSLSPVVERILFSPLKALLSFAARKYFSFSPSGGEQIKEKNPMYPRRYNKRERIDRGATLHPRGYRETDPMLLLLLSKQGEKLLAAFFENSTEPIVSKVYPPRSFKGPF